MSHVGQQRLTLTLPDRDSLNGLAETLARLLSLGAAPQATGGNDTGLVRQGR